MKGLVETKQQLWVWLSSSFITAEESEQEEKSSWKENHSQEIHVVKKEINAERGDRLPTGLPVSDLLLADFSCTQRLSWFEETGLFVSATH